MKIYNKVFLTLLFFYSINIQAQWINCNSKYYIDSVFDFALTDTVKFGENYSPAGLLKELEMHIYQPVDDTSTYRPAVVLAFGGAYLKGDKVDVRPICEDFASRGYVCASIDYRLMDLLVFPDSSVILDIGLKAREDMIAAIKYLKWDADNDNKWKINPDRVFVGGASSGAITAMSVAYFNEEDSIDVEDWMKPIIENNGGFEGNSHLDFTEDYNHDVVGVANMLGAVVDLEYIDEGEPIIVSIHGTEDDVVPYGDGHIQIFNQPIFRLYGSSLVHERALDENIESSFISVEGGKHGGFLKDESLPWLDSMMNTTLLYFYNYVLCPEPSVVLEKEKDRISVYPIPATDRLNIVIGEFSKENFSKCEIYSVTGELLNSKIIDSQNFDLDISNLKSGIYFLKLFNGNKSTVRSFIVN